MHLKKNTNVLLFKNLCKCNIFVCFFYFLRENAKEGPCYLINKFYIFKNIFFKKFVRNIIIK